MSPNSHTSDINNPNRMNTFNYSLENDQTSDAADEEIEPMDATSDTYNAADPNIQEMDRDVPQITHTLSQLTLRTNNQPVKRTWPDDYSNAELDENLRNIQKKMLKISGEVVHRLNPSQELMNTAANKLRNLHHRQIVLIALLSERGVF